MVYMTIKNQLDSEGASRKVDKRSIYVTV